MSYLFIQLVVFGALAGLGNVVGGLLLFPSRLHTTYKRYLNYLLAVGAGFMFAVTLLEIFPRALELWSKDSPAGPERYTVPFVLVTVGYLATQFFEHTVAPHFHLGEEVHTDTVLSVRSAYAGIAGLLIHTFFDGVSIAAAAQIDPHVGFLVFLAVFMHKLPEGFTIGSMVLASGRGFREVLIATGLIGSATLLGVIGFYLVGARFENAVMYALPLAAGVTLYVAASDLIPEVNHHGGKRPFVSLSVFGGVGLFFLVRFLLSFFSHSH
ncbi:MAG TPA: ZIP family metal transporter [Pyrinomonadaceae bacterium]|nr:ZIP family metal transporter [Pyrinomonadaceae bacterium]